MPALCAGMQPSPCADQSIEIGATIQCPLAGRASNTYQVESGDGISITVRNLGRGTILSATDNAGSLILRSANWRGAEHLYRAVFDLPGPIEITIAPDNPVAPPGDYELTVTRLDPESSEFRAELAMTRGADVHLRYYFDEASSLEQARDSYLDAASQFANNGNSSRRADALFEAANVMDEMGQRTTAFQTFLLAEEIWSISPNDKYRRGIASSQNLRGLIRWSQGDLNDAIRLFESSAEIRRELGAPFDLALALNNLGLAYRDLGDPRLAKQYLEDALDILEGDFDTMDADPKQIDFDGLENPPHLQESLIALQNLGWANDIFGNIGLSQQIYEQALALSQYLDRGRTAAELQSNLGRLMYRTGRLQEAMRYFNEALAYFTGVSGNAFWAGRVYLGIALVHRATGDDARAVDALEKSLELSTAERNPPGRARALQELAEISLEKVDLDAAMRWTDESLVVLRDGAISPLMAAAVHDLAARVYFANGRHEDALGYHDRAVTAYRTAEHRRGEAIARANRAMSNNSSGRHSAAIQELLLSEKIVREIDGRVEQFRILTNLAQAYLDDGQPDEALVMAEEAIELHNEFRDQLTDPVLTRNFASAERTAYEILVAANLQLDLTEEAWRIADLARAPRFTDLLRRSRVDIGNLTESQQQRYVELRQSIAALADARTEFLAQDQFDNAEIALQELTPLVDEMALLQELARKSLADRSISLDSESIIASLGPADLVLEYFLGDSIAGLWLITAESIEFRSLGQPSLLRDGLISAANDLRTASSASRPELGQLSELLLPEHPALLSDLTNLIVVPDGELHFVPFSVLLDPATGFEQPLVASRNVSYLPSMAALLELRGRTSEPGQGIAVIANPVFDFDDPRVQRIANVTSRVSFDVVDPDLTRSTSRAGRREFVRLPGTVEEARAIEGAAGDQEVLTVTGTGASRDFVLSGGLQKFEIVHFATHGVLDTEEPALSGLVLSGVDGLGNQMSRFLRSQEIAGLSLDAQLVVLSGCDTGVGRAIRGEGLLGLSRAFFSAGAQRVVSSLWQVPDRATAVLMGHFYAELLQNGASPGQALRIAQLRLQNDPRWRDPYFWAAFIVQGDWR